MADWISVKDRLPEYGQEVVAVVNIFSGGLIKETRTVVTRYAERFKFEFFMAETYFVTYWMPLPEVPGERESSAPELVRCKECRNGEPSGFEKNKIKCNCSQIGGFHRENFFCAAGRRKEEEQNGE